MAKRYGRTKCELEYLYKMPTYVKTVKESRKMIEKYNKDMQKCQINSKRHKKLGRYIKQIQNCKPNYKGAYGEEMAVKILMELPDDYIVFGGVEISQMNNKSVGEQIDIVVVGPTGIFAIEVKNCKRNMHRNLPYRQAIQSAEILANYLGEKVTPILLDIHDIFSIKESFANVVISDLDSINGIIIQKDVRLDDTNRQKYTQRIKNSIKIPKIIQLKLTSINVSNLLNI